MSTNATSPKSDVIEFIPNQPQLLAIKYPQPKVVQGKFGDRAMFSLTDGRVCFLDIPVAEKIAAAGNTKIILTERGASFGYNNLVVDMRTFPVLRKFGYPVVYDVTHSVQLPGGQGHASGGQPEFIEPLARAGVAAGVDGIFLETHDNPAAALSDGPNALPLSELSQLLSRLKEISTLARRWSTA